MKKYCQECKEVLKGRSDQKFCSDLCRNSYNNRLNSDCNSHIRNVNNILRKNRRIMSLLINGDKLRIHKSKLSEKGFNFNYHTNIYTTQKGASYFFCYEFGYLPMEHEYILLVKRKSELAG